MSDLIERLREKRPYKGMYDDEAADRIEELQTVIAWANNSLFGSHGFFLSDKGESDNEHHLDSAIENLKSTTREQYAKINHLESALKRLGSGELFKPDNVSWLDWLASGGELIAYIDYANKALEGK